MWDRGPWIGPAPSSTVPVDARFGDERQATTERGNPQIRSYRGRRDSREQRRTGTQQVTERTPRARRPAHYADLTALIDAAGGATTVSRSEIAATTAAALVRAGRDVSGTDPRFVELADRIGLDTLAELWREAEPISLAGSLWALYLLRQWCRSAADEVVALWRAGEPRAPADAVVAGVAPLADPESLARVADDVLTGAYGGDFAVALERAAALFRVLAAGRRELAGLECDATAAAQLDLAERNEQAAVDLAAAACRWRQGRLH
jgi:hypothetical protein